MDVDDDGNIRREGVCNPSTDQVNNIQLPIWKSLFCFHQSQQISLISA